MNATLDYYGLVRPHAGHRHAGDATVVVERQGTLLAAIVDVLGHGPEAHDVALRAQRYLDAAAVPADPVAVLHGLHEALKGTRGAAAGVALVDTATGVLRYAGVGNTVMRRFGAGPDRLVSVDGVVGGNMRTPREQRLSLSRGDTVVMHTDGVRDRFELREYPQLPLQDAETIARTLIKLYGKDHDDAACIAVRYDP